MKLTTKITGALLTAGCLIHAINYYYLGNDTIQDVNQFWLFLLAPTVAGCAYLMHQMEVLKDSAYVKKLGRSALIWMKAVMTLAALLGSMLMFGGLLNFGIYSLNYLSVDRDLVIEEFKVIDVDELPVRLYRDSEKCKVRVCFADDSLQDDLMLVVNRAEFESRDFDSGPATIVIGSAYGMLGLRIVQDVQFDLKNK